ncbi:hypothetical protein HELRODRAFT_170824 [Helobdella robusta]|uniref:Spaetzle domain-containing protein n=1 Tax=Helobdella robusta TaxID=6412 RepID=T1F3H1_HELRO|nr:hypothetical protein HELRODRAFT_170824 [Helobdella robusta]ESO06802.1 hypothetical protein HELRODRAFT_170824 [Helobdella robusta]
MIYFNTLNILKAVVLVNFLTGVFCKCAVISIKSGDDAPSIEVDDCGYYKTIANRMGNISVFKDIICSNKTLLNEDVNRIPKDIIQTRCSTEATDSNKCENNYFEIPVIRLLNGKWSWVLELIPVGCSEKK